MYCSPFVYKYLVDPRKKVLKVEFSFAKFAKISIYARIRILENRETYIFFLFDVEFDSKNLIGGMGENIVRNFSKRFVIEVYQ